MPPAAGLFSAQSVVVLLTGIPGDIESENNYRDQLQSWRDLVSASGTAAEIFVLCDDPSSQSANHKETTGQTANPNSQTTGTRTLEVLKGDREAFLGLGRKLAGSTNPLVVIAWGHGGRQGSTAVFHVRGPRITPSDFKTVANQVAAHDSRWILMFPGSGVFASQIAGEGRQVISSECDTMFTSDPVGMSLLLKLARDKPGLSFEGLGEEFGRMTAQWYASRNLARTEEPTLWHGTERPRLLAAGAETNSLASIPPAEEDKAAAKKPSEPQTVKANLPAAWKEITRVEAQKYPDADAVVLRRRCSYTLGSDPAVASEQDEYVQILTVEGKRFGDFDVTYSPPHEDISFLDCEVLRADGQLVRLDPEAIRDGREQSVGDYNPGQRKFFSLPGVGPGAIVHVRYRTEWKSFPLPHVSLTIPVDRELPAIEASVEVSVPKASAFHFALDHVSAADPMIKQTEYGTTYRWRFENLPAHEQELLVAPRLSASGVQISTFPDWDAFADWYGRISKLTDEVTPEIAAKAKELTKDATAEREKLMALYNYVTSLRYVAVPLGVNSYRPHAAASVFQNQFGDCKDKANLLNTLLHAIKIEARLVLVPRFSQADERMPGFAFNHAISQVILGDETLWVDTTDDVCRFGMLPPGDPGRKVLVIDGKTNALTRLPVADPKAHRLELRGEVDLAGPAEALPLTLNAVATGYPDYELREARRQTREHGLSLTLLGVRFRPVAGAFALEKQTSSSVSALNENFSWQAQGSWVGSCAEAGGVRSLRAPFWLPREWDTALNHRKEGLFLNQGYPLTLDEAFVFKLPNKAHLATLPGAAENQTEPLRWRIEWTKVSDDKLGARLRAELVRGELSPTETPVLQEQLQRLAGALAAGINITETN